VRLWFAILSLFILTAASAPRYKGNWIAAPDGEFSGVIVFEKGKYQKIGRAVPARMFELRDDSFVAKGAITYLGRGTLMVPVDSSLRRFCRFERHLGSAFGCLSDTDGDGKLDSYFGAQVFKDFFTGTVGDEGGHESLTKPVSFAEIDSFVKSPQIDLEFVYLGKSMQNELVYQFCLSKKITDNLKFYSSSSSRKGYSVLCTTHIRNKLTDKNSNIQGFGVAIEIRSAAEKILEAKLIQPTDQTFETSSSFR
jgi:hypothetical protein